VKKFQSNLEIASFFAKVIEVTNLLMTTRVQHYLEIDNLRKKVDLILGIETICDNVNG